MTDITDNELSTKIKDILHDADLTKVTSKSIRIKLEAEFKTDLSSKKSLIEKMIMEVLESKQKTEDSSSDESLEDESPRKKVSPPPKKKMNNVTTKAKSPPKKQPLGPDYESTDDDDDDDSLVGSSPKHRAASPSNDEEVARQLQESENGSRNKRRAASAAVPGVNKPTKKKKTESRNGGTKTKSKTGYNRPLILSEELADYLGEKEMPRHDIVKRFWDIAKETNMFDPKNKQFVVCDAEWERLFNRKRFRMFGIMKHLKRHLSHPDNFSS